MKYPMFKVHVDVDAAMDKVREVLESGYLNEGVQVNQLKQAMQEYLQHGQIIPLNSCTSALTLALKASDVGPGTEVITTSMTCIATNTPIKNLGADVVWVDINSRTGNIDPELVEQKITSKTKAIMCVDWAGLPCDLEKLQRIATKHGIKLIQDAAHAFGAIYKGKHVCHATDFTCYSLQAIKHVTSGDGGILVCNNADDYIRVKKLKWFGYDRDAAKDEKGEWKGQRWDADVEEAGYKFNMNNLSAAVGLANVPHFDEILRRHRRNAKLYQNEFSEVSGIRPLAYPRDSDPSFWVYTVKLDSQYDRDAILESLNRAGINAGLVHIPNHHYTCFRDSFEELVHTEYFNSTQISLPCGWWLELEDVYTIADSLINACKRYEE